MVSNSGTPLQDIKIVISIPPNTDPFCFYQPVLTTDKNSIDLLARFPDLHPKATLQYDSGVYMSRFVILNAGHFYTSETTDTNIKLHRIRGGKLPPEAADVVLAKQVGCNIKLSDDMSTILNADGTEIVKGGVHFQKDHVYDIQIFNDPPSSSLPPKPSQGVRVETDFKDYYRVVQGVMACDQVSYQFIVSFVNPDVPCMPGGGLFP
jgi:hypothetical protein